jgi:hypothetical protein
MLRSQHKIATRYPLKAQQQPDDEGLLIVATLLEHFQPAP